MEDGSRTRLVALAVLLAISVPLTVIAIAGSSSGDSESGLTVEEARGAPQLLVYVNDPGQNELETSGGRRQVAVECLDSEDAVVFEAQAVWPFTDTDGGRFDPHVHLNTDPSILAKVERCRLKGTDPPLEGPKV